MRATGKVFLLVAKLRCSIQPAFDGRNAPLILELVFRKLRQVPAISDAIRQLHVQKLQANKRPV